MSEWRRAALPIPTRWYGSARSTCSPSCRPRNLVAGCSPPLRSGSRRAPSAPSNCWRTFRSHACRPRTANGSSTPQPSSSPPSVSTPIVRRHAQRSEISLCASTRPRGGGRIPSGAAAQSAVCARSRQPRRALPAPWTRQRWRTGVARRDCGIAGGRRVASCARACADTTQATRRGARRAAPCDRA